MQYAHISANRKASTLSRSEEEQLSSTNTPQNIISLQRVIGNKAAQAVAQQGRMTMKGGVQLQRKEGHNCGGRCPICQPVLKAPNQGGVQRFGEDEEQTSGDAESTVENPWFADWKSGETPAAQENTPTESDVMGWVAPNLESVGLGAFGGLPGSEPLNQNSASTQASSTTFKKRDAPYTLHGKNAAELSQDILNNANPEVGSITVTPDLTTQTSDDKVISAQIIMDIEKRMPTWAERDSVKCPALVQEWDRWYKALDAHENGHMAIDMAGYANIHQVYIGKPEPEGEAAFEVKKTDIDKLHTAFHGTPVGANPTFDGGIPCP